MIAVVIQSLAFYYAKSAGIHRVSVTCQYPINRLKIKDVEFTLARQHGNSGLFSVPKILHLCVVVILGCHICIHLPLL